MDQKLQKSLTDLIDETLQELDELRKSKFAASEIKIEGPGDGIAGKPSDGKLDAAKADDEKKEIHVDIDSHKEEDEDEKEEAKKGENEEAAKAEDKDEDKKEDKKSDKKDDDKGGEKHEAKERKAIGELADLAGMKKSLEDSESLMKSYVEERIKPVEDKLATILDLVNKIADAPVAPKGVPANAAPLFKSAGEGEAEPLTKSQVANKLFELKKSGTKVDSNDIVKAEMGQDLKQIVKKYEIS